MVMYYSDETFTGSRVRSATSIHLKKMYFKGILGANLPLMPGITASITNKCSANLGYELL